MKNRTVLSILIFYLGVILANVLFLIWLLPFASPAGVMMVGGGTPSSTTSYQDFTAWTEVDADSDLTVEANQITISTLTNDAACVWKDFGVDHFTGIFTHKFSFQITAETGATVDGLWFLSNTTAPVYGNTGITVYCWNVAGTEVASLYIENVVGGTSDNINYNLLLNTTYYVTIARDISNNVTVQVYTDSGRTTQVGDTLTVSNSTAYRYMSMAFESNGTSSWSGVINNLDIGE